MVYTASSESCAQIEMRVHFQGSDIFKRYAIFELSIPKPLIEILDEALLPAEWWRSPASLELRRIGDEWARRRQHAVLAVPSSVARTDFVYILNPLHADYAEIVVEREWAFRFDPRLA